MLEFLCSIPEEIGWVIVGAMGMFTFGFFLQALFIPIVARPIIDSIKRRWKLRKKMKKVAN